MSTDLSNAESVLTDWVLQLNPAADPSTVTTKTPLLSERLISSLQIAELLLILETLRGEPVDIGKLQPGAFRDIETIIQTFLADDA